MTSDTPHQSGTSTDKKPPEWANGLRQLYDSVVEEPLPDSFTDLLAQLDCQSEDEPDAKSKGGDHAS